MSHKARAWGRRARCRLSPEARRAMRALRPRLASPNVEALAVGRVVLVALVVQAAAARRRATRLHLRSVRSRAAMLTEARCRGLVHLCQERKVVGRNGGQRDECSEEQ